MDRDKLRGAYEETEETEETWEFDTTDIAMQCTPLRVRAPENLTDESCGTHK